MSASIHAIGTATPATRRTQVELADAAASMCVYSPEQDRLMRRLYEGSTIRERAGVAFDIRDGNGHMPLYRAAPSDADRGPTTGERVDRYLEGAGALASDSARAAMARAGTVAREVTHVITASCTGFAAPGVDVSLIGSLGLKPTVARTCVGFMGCHGALNALRVASAMVRSEAEACALVCAVELCSLHFHYVWDAEKVLANALFADGAASAVVRSGAGEWEIRDSGSCLVPDSRDVMTWRIGDHGFEMTLSREVVTLIRERLGGWMREWLGGHGLGVGDVRSWAIHPGGPRILDAVEEGLGLGAEATRVSREVLGAHGNMSSPTVLFILERLREEGARGPCVALGFGPGLAIEAALLG